MRRPLALLTLALLTLALIAAACSTTEGTTSSMPVFTTSPDATGSTSTTTTAAPPTSTAPVTTTAATTPTSAAATTTTSLPPEDLDLALVEVAGGLAQPVFVAAPPGDERLFVVEQAGRIQLLATGIAWAPSSTSPPWSPPAGSRASWAWPSTPTSRRPPLLRELHDRSGDTVVAEYRVSARSRPWPIPHRRGSC